MTDFADDTLALPATARSAARQEVRARDVGDAAAQWTWRIVHARRKEPFLASTVIAPLRRVYYTADDGWRAPLHVLPAAGTGAGAPVLLVHGLGGTWRDFALEPVGSLARSLAAAGYTVYLATHRGDREAIAPPDARAFDLDDIAARDLPAAIDAVRADSGFARVIAVGHALGGQALYLLRTLAGSDGLAGLATLCAPVDFVAPASAARQAGLVAALLPRRWAVPARAALRFALPFVDAAHLLDAPRTPGPVARARLRHGSADLHAGVLAQLARCVSVGHLCDRTGRVDVVAGLDAYVPALVLVAAEDARCRPEQVRRAAEALGTTPVTVPGGHLDPLTAEDAREAACDALLTWMSGLHDRCRVL